MAVWDACEAVCIARDGTIYLYTNNGIVHLEASGEILRRYGNIDLQVISMCPYRGDCLLLLDSVENIVAVFDTNSGKVIDEMFGPFGTVVDICVFNGKFFISDMEKSVLHMLDEDGVHLGVLGSEGTGKCQFQSPHGITAHPVTRELYVCDTGNHRVQVLGPNGEFLRSFGQFSDKIGGFNGPCGIAVNFKTNVIAVVDCNGVQGFDACLLGKVLWELKEVSHPSFVDFDCEGDILVNDSNGIDWFASPLVEQTSNSNDDENGDDSEGTNENSKEDFDATESIEEQSSDSEYSESEYSEDEDDNGEQEKSIACLPCLVYVENEDTKSESEDLKYECENEYRKNESEDLKCESEKEYTKSESDDMKNDSERIFDENVQSQKTTTMKPVKKDAAKSAANIHRKFVADVIDMKEKLVELKSLAEKLQKKYDALEQKRFQLEPANLQIRDPVSELKKKSNSVSGTLDSIQAIESCKDILAIEERSIEIQILHKDTKRILPVIQEKLKLALGRSRVTEQQLRDSKNQLDKIPKKFTQDQNSKTTHEQSLSELRNQKIVLESNHKQSMKQLRLKKQGLENALDELSDDLNAARHLGDQLERKCNRLKTKTNKNLERKCNHLKTETNKNEIVCDGKFKEVFDQFKAEEIDAWQVLEGIQKLTKKELDLEIVEELLGEEFTVNEQGFIRVCHTLIIE